MRSLESKLEPANVVALVDSREKTPLELAPLRTQTSALATGDYSVLGLEHVVAVERKSLPDLLSCVGVERDRFDREIQRMLAFPVRILVVEASWQNIEKGDWRSRLTSQQVLGSLLGWIGRGIQVELVGDHERAGRFVSRILFTIARRHYEQLKTFHRRQVESVEGPSSPQPLGEV